VPRSDQWRLSSIVREGPKWIVPHPEFCLSFFTFKVCLLLTFHSRPSPLSLSSSSHLHPFCLLCNRTRRYTHHIMPNLYNPSYQDSFQPTPSPAARDENRRPYLNLSQPLTSMGRRQKSHIQTFGPNQGGPRIKMEYLGSNFLVKPSGLYLPTYVIRHISIYGNMTSSPWSFWSSTLARCLAGFAYPISWGYLQWNTL